MASTITIPSGLGECSSEVATNDAARGNETAELANAIIDVATTAKSEITALQSAVAGAAANEAAIKAIPAAARVNGQICVDLTNDVAWIFDSGSAAGASAWVLVPDAGSGRWLRNHPSLADLASTSNGYGADLMGSDAAGYVATTVSGQLAEVKVLADAAIGVVKRTVTVGHADLTDAVNGEAQAINIGAVLPANARIAYVDAHDFTPFTGGGAVSVDMKIGSSGDVDAIISASDVLSAAVDGGPSTLTRGIRPNKLFAGAGAQLLATFTPDGAHNLNDLTAGSIIIDVYYFVSA